MSIDNLTDIPLLLHVKVTAYGDSYTDLEELFDAFLDSFQDFLQDQTNEEQETTDGKFQFEFNETELVNPNRQMEFARWIRRTYPTVAALIQNTDWAHDDREQRRRRYGS